MLEEGRSGGGPRGRLLTGTSLRDAVRFRHLPPRTVSVRWGKRGRVVAYKVTRGGIWLGDYQSVDELAKVVDIASLDEL